MGLPNILQAIKLLKTYPDYRFVLDQACYIKPFLERYPEEGTTFRKFVDEGRLAIVGGTDVMLDVNMPGGESFIRQVLYGKGYFRKKLGVDVTTGWQLDTFGHHAQMPQLLKLAGYKSFWFFRGVPDNKVPSEFIWEGIDGSRIPAFWLPHGYTLTYGSPKSLPEFTKFIKEKFDALASYSRGPGRVGLAGADVSEPEEHLSRLVDEFNQQPDKPFHLRIAVPSDFEKLAAKRDMPVIKCELNPVFQGIYSSRIELKQYTRELEKLLTTAEKLGVLLHYLGVPVDDEVVWQAWEPMLFNQAHDLMSGVMTDHVYEDTVRGYDFSKRLAQEELESRIKNLSSKIDTQGEGPALVVFNSLGWSRTDVVFAKVEFPDRGVMAFKLVDPDGKEIPVQLTEAQYYEDNTLLRAEIAFIAPDVPAMGYCVYRLIPLKSVPDSAANKSVYGKDDFIENEHCRVEFDKLGGGIKNIFVKKSQWSVLKGPGNVVTIEEDKGDFWELYHPLDGGSNIAVKNRQFVPQRGRAIFSDEQKGEPGSAICGPVFSEFRITHPFGSNGTFGTVVRLYAGLHRIDIRTQILNNEQFVRYRVLFPTSIQEYRSVHEIPFGAIQRPEGIEFPAQNWIDCSNGNRGVALLNRGLPGNNTADGTIMLSLMRSTRIVAYGYGGGYEPGMSSDSGLESGKELTFDYSLVPHNGDWHQAGIYQDGVEFNNPLIAFTVPSHPGVLPGKWGFLEISHPNVVMSALKQGENGTVVLRIYEATGQPADGVKIEFSARVISSEEVNLMEEPIRKIKSVNNVVQLNLKPFEIKTIRLNVQQETVKT